MVTNILTIDFEDWFCANNLSSMISRNDWSKCEIRINNNINRILELLDKYNTKATFFVLGWLAERVPDLIFEIHNKGHEIASHGYSHIAINNMTHIEFEKDLHKALSIKKDIINCDIKGYRSPSFSITKGTLWAFDILIKHGIEYDSSVYPLSYHPEYGISNAPTQTYKLKTNLIEVPLSVKEFFGLRIPFGGGGYFRLYPYFVTRYLIKSINKTGRPFIFYLHPWEIDSNQPRMKIPLLKRFRHYYNIKNNIGKFEKVLHENRFSTIQEFLKYKTVI